MKKILLTSLVISSSAFAIVSIKPIEITNIQEIKYEIGMSYSTKSGNSDVKSTALSLKSTQYDIGYANMLVLDHEYGESSGTKNTDKTFAHIRHIRATDDERLNYELFVQAQKDTFRSIQSRYLTGVGVRYKVNLENDSSVFFGLGIFNTQLKEDNTTSSFESINSYISYNQVFDSGAKLTYNGYFQPRIDSLDDYQISQKAQLSFKITNAVSLTFNLNHTYDASPASGVEKSDLSTKTGLNYKF
jgi:hypothetical protein